MEAEVDGFRARCHVVRTAEGGQEIVNGCFVGQVDDGKPQTPFVAIAVEEIVVANRKIKEISRLNAWRILVVILGSGLGYLQESGAVLGGRTTVLHNHASLN